MSDVTAGTLQRTLARGQWVWKMLFKRARSARHAGRRVSERGSNAIVNRLKDWLRAIRRPWRAASRRKAHIQERVRFYKVEWNVEREIERLAARDRTLVVGPWFSEVGFETLYWVPFLHWVKTAFHVDPARVVAVSRGGVSSWYQGVADRYVEIWDDMDPGEFARRNAARGVVKQHQRTELDDDILQAVARRIGTSDFDVIHPSLMYTLFGLYWQGQRAMGFVDAHLRFTTVTPPRIIDPALLPADYVAVKFYAARSLPDSPALRQRLRAIVAQLAERSPVVLLDSGLVLEDDHADYGFAAEGRVVSARSLMQPANNLGVQTQIIGGARSFVGTCGSIAWLAPRLGVDTSALFVDPKWLHAHLGVAMRGYHRLGAGRFAVADLRAVDPTL